MQGRKIALFDVSDVKNPVEKAKYELGKEWSNAKYSWSDSNALYEHKAFLFDKEKNLLVIPVSYNKMYENYSLQEISDAMNQSDIKNTIDSPDIDLSNAPSPSGNDNVDFPNPPTPNADDYANMSPYQDISTNTKMSTDYSNQSVYNTSRIW